MEFVVDQKQIENLKLKFKSYDSWVRDGKILDTIAIQLKNNIYLRTQSGKDVRFSSFKPYNTTYAKLKGKTTVNLTDTAQMLNSMTHKSLNNNAVMIFFNGQHKVEKGKKNISNSELAKKHNEGLGVPMREFFGVSSQDRSLAFTLYQKAAIKAKKDIGL